MFDVFPFLSGDFFAFNDEASVYQNPDAYNSDNLCSDPYQGFENNSCPIISDYPDTLLLATSENLPQASVNCGHLYIGDTIIGDPYNDMQFIHMQEGMKSCAVASQKAILDSLGLDVPEIELSYMAYQQGWFDPAAGTMPDDMGKILEAFNIPVERGYDYSITDIYNALENGEKIMVGLDANEIWNPQYDADGNPIEQQDNGHAVWVTGLYQDDDENWFVVMNDSGRPDGAGETVPVADFFNAWNDFGNLAVITNTHGQMNSSPGMGIEDIEMVGAAQDISMNGKTPDAPDISHISNIEGLAPTSDELNRLKNIQSAEPNEQTGSRHPQYEAVGSSSCSDCSGSCWLTCSGSCENSTD